MIFNPIFGQENPFLDSLVNVLPNASEDTNKVILLSDIAWELKFEDPQKARSLLDSALSLAKALNYQKGEGNAYNYRGVVEDIHGNSEVAIEFFEKSLLIRQELGDKIGVAKLYNNIGNVNDNLGNQKASLQSYFEALKLYRELGDSVRVARASYNLGISYENVGNFQAAQEFILQYLSLAEITKDSTAMANAYNVLGNIRTEKDDFTAALDNYQTALFLHKSQNNQWEIGTALNNIGNTYDSQGEQKMDKKEFDGLFSFFENATKYHLEAIDIRKELEDLDGEGESYNNIGLVYKNIGSYYLKIGDPKQANEYWERALNFLDTALQIRQELGDQFGLIEVYNGFGDVYRRQEKYKTALDFTKKYLAIAEESNNEKFLQNGYKDLARLYNSLGDFKEAYKWRKEYDELRYERYNKDRLKEFESREVFYSDRQKEWENERELLVRDSKLKEAAIFRNSLIVGAIGLLLLIGLIYNRYLIKSKSNQELESKNKIIEIERERSDALLLNILPEATANELKENGKAAAKKYESVTVLFTDFESFTKIAEKLSPEQLVAQLDECFRAFDEIISRHNIEKIKTIGDAYMCAGGLPEKNNTHAEDIIRAALEMRDFMTQFGEKQRKEGRPEFRTRFGIHSGPVVAGVVGSKKFAFDIWGDTVNVASRMESKSEPGKVNISKDTYNLIKQQFRFENRGKLIAKNKGEIEMFFVEHLTSK
ncbi:MAG: adenylate/guanylate cyclase domain-containing protein [Saprospiraceae bacterium]|nr:adenylate/guanylate cyclase domain-containing protein [Saprospiraceae bacterium]